MNARVSATRSVTLDDIDGPTADLVRRVQAEGGPVVLTRDGVPLAVLLSPADFEALEADADRRELQQAVEAAEEQVSAGDTLPHEEVVAELDRWIGNAG